MTYCKHCSKIASYSKVYDAYLCESCNEWTEEICSDDWCHFCSQRPLRPFSGLDLEALKNTDEPI